MERFCAPKKSRRFYSNSEAPVITGKEGYAGAFCGAPRRRVFARQNLAIMPKMEYNMIEIRRRGCGIENRGGAGCGTGGRHY